jgi:AcrR family transcriptional regulator
MALLSPKNAPKAAPRKERQSQAEKSAAMRERILDATIDCLVDLGYARTTTIEVTERAGVSRGAMLHHFPSKIELVTAAGAHLADRLLAEFAAKIREFPLDSDVIATAIDLVWEYFSSPASYALLELTVAARTDRELYEQLRPQVVRLEDSIAQTTRELFGVFAPKPKQLEVGRQIIYYLMHGLAVMQIWRANSEEADYLLKQLKRQAVADARAALEALTKPRRKLA